MHHLQKLRAANFQTVKTIIAKAMPNGISDSQLKSYLMMKYGFSRFKVEEYLNVLEESAQIEKTDETWRMVVPNVKLQNQTEACVEDADQ